ncbi:Immediate early protein ICP0 [Myxococcus sp. K38C18041901]|uniref:Immediate early protein ICP0 n=1 Tax=Myxococcus guangdongensis TaxID=2906760 RepID=UPI0020A809C5|nr:Immediate early protein ICP0 [Myxococcus guangdongensis]MCP3059271.1 Immediate early protein ICP0 [Myxococcus guangdongensis]
MASSSRIPSAFARLAQHILKSPAGAIPRVGLKSPEVGRFPVGNRDGFKSQAPATGHPTLGGQERAPPRRVAELVPPGLEKLVGQDELGVRFGSDAALLMAHLQPSGMSGSERATRLWAFFAAYAETAAAQPPHQDGKEAFRESLEGHGFAELRDAHTGKDGVTQGLWVLEARTPDEARERVASVRLEPPPEVRHSEAAVRAESAVDPGLAAQARGPDSLRGAPAPVAMRPAESQDRDGSEADDEARPRRTSNKKLGAMMLWNVLHRFRSDPEDGSVAQGQWDRVAFGAVLALVGIALVVLALVSL